MYTFIINKWPEFATVFFDLILHLNGKWVDYINLKKNRELKRLLKDVYLVILIMVTRVSAPYFHIFQT